MIQSVDSVDLLQKLDAAAAESGRAPELLIQVDLAGEDDEIRRTAHRGPATPRRRRRMPAPHGSSGS